ncbi:valine--pyruvate transaminase [Ferrimonas pelagia]|uniref:Valine--pyruvate transaminase n=1 Tax=Ferrimonas pelagia TaxID=1177826 RepID=A0ABP9EWI2_9GAMM
MKISLFGQRFSLGGGTSRLMEDLGAPVLKGQERIMMGGGNPAAIPQLQQIFRQRMQQMLDDEGQECEFDSMLGAYDPPQGEGSFMSELAALLQQMYGWDITADNIALTNGSQSAFFCLFNMFAGRFSDGSFKQVLLPLAPEYIGYAEQGLEPGLFTSRRPEIELIGEHQFKYHVDFDALAIDDRIGAICVSRPTNPTGNVLTNDEIERLSLLAEQHNIPLLLDNAYGLPFPGLVYTDAAPYWREHIVLSLSLSKFGLPGTRTGIVIANPKIIDALSKINAIVNLASGSVGAAIARELVSSGEIIDLSENVIKPYYQTRMRTAFDHLATELSAIPGLYFRIHRPEGAFFLWLWLPSLPVTSQQLYQRLKARGVIIVPGHYFFPGLEEDWPHKNECIRISYAAEESVVKKGLSIIADEIREIFSE